MKKFIIILVLIIVGVSAFYFIIQSQSVLPGYVENEPVAEAKPEEQSAVALKSHIDETTNFQIGIPEDWTEVIKGGNKMYVHAATGSSVLVEVCDYYPQINTVSADSCSAFCSANGLIGVDFYWVDNSSFVFSYQQNLNEKITDFIELTYFDREHVVTVTISVPDEIYDKMQNTVSAIIDSVSWNRSSPIREDVKLSYNEFGDFEYATPIKWSSAVRDGVYYAQDQETGAVLTITVSETTELFSNVSQLDYTNEISKGRTGFMLSSYYSDDSTIYAQGSYQAADYQLVFIQYLLRNGAFQYSITFECPSSAYDSMKDLFSSCIDYFRVFSSPEPVIQEEIPEEEPKKSEEELEKEKQKLIESLPDIGEELK